ncbi:hypothetical protein ACFLYT_00215 [Nanoarchaeota archaeon]
MENKDKHVIKEEMEDFIRFKPFDRKLNPRYTHPLASKYDYIWENSCDKIKTERMLIWYKYHALKFYLQLNINKFGDDLPFPGDFLDFPEEKKEVFCQVKDEILKNKIKNLHTHYTIFYRIYRNIIDKLNSQLGIDEKKKEWEELGLNKKEYLRKKLHAIRIDYARLKRISPNVRKALKIVNKIYKSRFLYKKELSEEELRLAEDFMKKEVNFTNCKLQSNQKALVENNNRKESDEHLIKMHDLYNQVNGKNLIKKTMDTNTVKIKNTIVPDCEFYILVDDEIRKIAVEIEISMKSSKRITRRCYELNENYDEVIFVFGRKLMKKADKYAYPISKILKEKGKTMRFSECYNYIQSLC